MLAPEQLPELLTTPFGASPIPPDQVNTTVMSTPPEHGSISGLYAAIRLARLVSSFRRRIKSRVHPRGTGKKEALTKADQKRLCDAFEEKAFREIDKYLGRKHRHGGKRLAKIKIEPGQSPSESTFGHADAKPVRIGREYIESLLDRLGDQLPLDRRIPSDLAECSKLPLAPRIDCNISQGSRKLLCSLTLIGQLLATVQLAYRQGKDIEATQRSSGLTKQEDVLDHLLFLANLEHILLCLQGQVLYQLFIVHGRKTLENDVFDSQKAYGRECKQWFFVFPRGRRPLSTTWPWNIRPSLVVLWGVCWMFYPSNDPYLWRVDLDGNWWGALTGDIVVPAHVPNTRQTRVAASGWRMFQDLEHEHFQPPYPHPSHIGPRHPAWPMLPNEATGITGNNPGLVTEVPVLQTTNTAVEPDFALPRTDDDGNANALLFRPPRIHVEPAVSTNGPASSRYQQLSAVGQQRQSYSSGLGDQGASPPDVLSDHIRLTQLSDTAYQTAGAHYSNLWIHYQYNQQNLDLPFTPQSLPEMAVESPRGRPLSFDLHTQEQTARARSLSSNTQEVLDSAPGQSPAHSPLRSPVRSTGGSVNAGDEVSMLNPQPQRDKPRVPPTLDKDGKYTCTQCKIKPFDRRCEWNKHMDKHDRPYICKNPDCSSIQGFTYSGGLLRHEREVHNLHGGAKLKLFCTFEGCKRQAHSPFTRRENLAEHLRRVHKTSPEPSSPLTNDISPLTVNGDSKDHAETVVKKQQDDETDDNERNSTKKESDEPATNLLASTRPTSITTTQGVGTVTGMQNDSPMGKESTSHDMILDGFYSRSLTDPMKANPMTANLIVTSEPSTGIKSAYANKRKRDTLNEDSEAMDVVDSKDGDDLREQIKRLKQENDLLKQQQEAQEKATCEQSNEIESLRREVEKLVSVRNQQLAAGSTA